MKLMIQMQIIKSYDEKLMKRSRFRVCFKALALELATDS
jgi:hypothetical protein